MPSITETALISLGSALIGSISAMSGIFITEHFRRRSRMDAYASRVFDKRLEVYEGLLKKLRESASIVGELLNDSEISPQDREEVTSTAILELMEYCDEHAFYLNSEITVHCGASFVGVPDILEMTGEVRKSAVQHFQRDIRNAQRMILAESGVEEVNAYFRSITKADYTSDVIEYFRKKGQEQKKKDATRRPL